MSSVADFHSQVASILEALANAAVAEICKVVDDGYAVVNLEMSRSQKENEFLRRKIKILELQISRHRAERLRGTEGSASGRFYPGVRLLQHRQGRDTPSGSSLQSRTRFLNRASVVSQPPQKTPPVNLDQDPDQEVVTTTKTEPTEAEEDSELLIVKVEGNVTLEDTSVNSNNSAASRDPSSATGAPLSSDTEVSGSNIFNRNQPTNHCDKPNRYDDKTTNKLISDVIVIDGGGASDKEDVLGSDTGNRDQKSTPQSSSATFNETPGTSSGVTISFITNNMETFKQQASNVHPNVTIPTQSFQTFPLNSTQTASQSHFRPTFVQAATMERPFGCSKCTKRFFLELDLNKHITRHTRQKAYTCVLCGKGFVCRSQLAIHRNVHTGEQPFSCTVCSRRFSHPSNLKRHLKLQHQNTNPVL